MKTYQDWLKVAGGTERERMAFIKALINEHKASNIYKTAIIAEDYFAGQNTTIKRYEKMLYNARGQAVPDYFSANHKVASRFFYRSVMQANSTLLGNGITWDTGEGAKALGEDFDRKIIKVGRNAQVGGVCFGFYNNGRVEVYKITEFAPLYDEEDGALKAGARFWQVAPDKPLRWTASRNTNGTRITPKVLSSRRSGPTSQSSRRAKHSGRRSSTSGIIRASRLFLAGHPRRSRAS